MENDVVDPAAQGTAPPAEPPKPPAAAPAQPKKQTAPPAQKKPQGNQPKVIEIPEQAFKARVQREAAAEIKRRLGIPIEEAEKMVKSGGVVDKGNAAASAKATADKAVGEAQKWREKAEGLSRNVEDLKRKHAKDVQRMKDRTVEMELRFTAASLGIEDADYALHLFARAAASGKASDPKAFFEGLRQSHKYLFKAGAPAAAVPEAEPPPPTAVTPSTAPPESGATGEVKPSPQPPGDPKKQVNAEDMSTQDFQRHSKSKYGYTPGLY